MSGRGGDGFQYQSSRSNYRGGRGGHRGGGRGRGGEGGYRGGRGGHHYSQYDSAPKQPYQSQPQQQPQQQQAPPTQQPPAQQKPQASQTPNPAAKEFKSKLPPSVQKFDIPVRTSSAPPNLQEQEKHVHKKEFFPSKASIPFVPAHQYPQPPYYQPPFQQPFHDQSAAPVKPAATTASPQPKKRGLAIVDPNTGTDILTGEKVMEVKPEEPKKAETKTEETKEPETAPAQKEETGKPAEETEDKENEEEEGDEMEDEENGDEEEEEEEDKEEESGKRIYSKEFLLRFKDKFTQPPESLLHSEIFTGRAAGDAQKYPVSPKPQRGGRGRGGKQRGSGRGGARGGRGGKQQAKKAAWAVAKNEEEAVSKDALFILNKLAPETYTKLLEQFVKLPITSPEILKQVIYTIYDKAVYEPNFGSLYADLCSDLSQKLKVGTDNATAAFKKILLNRCQEEFEQKANASAGQASTEGEKEPTPEEKEEKEMKLRKRMVGNIIFIGELFKKKMLSEKIMHEVIKTLLVNDEVPTPDNLELLAKLLTTIGQLLDHEKASKFMDFYFSKLKALSTNKAIPSRNRYLIIDVLELRENAWVPRIKKETAKTKKEVHKEAEQEKLEQERIMREKAQKLGITSSRGGRGGGRGRGYDNRESRENKEKKGGQGGQEWTKAKRYTSGSIKAPSESRLGPPEKSAGAGSAGWGVAQSNAFAALMEDENAADESNQDSEAAPENVEESGKMEGEPLSEEELAKKLKSIIGNFTESGDEDDAMKDIKELVATEKYIIAKYLLKAAVEESNEQNFKDAQTLIVRTVDDKYFKSADFTKAAHECYKQMIENEVQVEAPVQLRQFAEVCGRLVGAGCLHLDDVDNVVASQPSVGGASLAEMLPYAYHGVRRHYEIIEADFKAIIKEFSATKLNVLKYINPSRSLEVDKFVNNMKKFKIEEMEPVSGILTYLQSQKDVDDVIAFVEDKLPDSHATTEKIMGAVITAIEITTMFARGKSNPEEEEKAMFEQYGKLLDSLTGSVDNQVILLNELQRFCSRTAFAKEVMGRLFKLFKDRWAYEEAIETWKKDDSIEGHAKALESIAE